jgi:hypothetical protein
VAEARYPAWEKRVALLLCVYEWIRERDAADNLKAVVDGEVLKRWASGIEGMSTTEAKYSLKQLVDEHYVTCVHMPTELSYEPFVHLVPQSLTEKGLLTIGEMPDPQERIILGVEAAMRSIQRDPTMDAAEKQQKIDWLEEFKHVVRSLTVETAKAVLRGNLPPM